MSLSGLKTVEEAAALFDLGPGTWIIKIIEGLPPGTPLLLKKFANLDEYY